MANRKASNKDKDEDFVLTIYDDDEAGLSPEELEDGVEDAVQDPEPEKPSMNGTKRKRDTQAKSKRKRQKQSEPVEEEESEDDAAAAARREEADGTIDPDFEFQMEDGIAELEDFDDSWTASQEKKPTKDVNIDSLVARMNGAEEQVGQNDAVELDGDEDNDVEDEELLEDDAFGMGADLDAEDDEAESRVDGETDSQDESAAESGDEDEEEDDDEIAAPVAHPDDLEAENSDEEEAEDVEENEKRAAFYAPESNFKADDPSKNDGSFLKMSLSRPVLKGLTAAGFTAPTPIQQKAVPVALLGKDVVGSAVTGSGKTGAFIIPILERLLYRSKKTATTRVAILMPTRELALQCFAVATKLASFTDITFGQAIGGLNSREQENALKRRPDIVIATPGRFIDFMRNSSSSFAVDTIEILVLDEADRMLEDGFKDELNEILKTVPKSRQTMLFSATMTSSVDDLIRVGLNRPVRLMIDASRSTVAGLTQEFVRLRPQRVDKRLGYLLHLCTSVYKQRTIIFFRQKKEAHRIRVVFALLGLKAAELHGSMSQDQRIHAIESFRAGTAAFLLATDLASRGLDIKNVETVINYEAPQSHEIYLHRVGRTARAGKTGRACTLAAEPDRKVIKSAVKAARAQGAIIKSRSIAPDDADHWADKAESMHDKIERVLREEKEEKVLAHTEMQMRRADNIMEHEKEILARPKKTWFESQRDKDQAKQRGRVLLNGENGDAEGGQQKERKKGKLSNKQKKALELKDERKEGRMWKKGKGDKGSVVKSGKGKAMSKGGDKKRKTKR